MQRRNAAACSSADGPGFPAGNPDARLGRHLEGHRCRVPTHGALSAGSGKGRMKRAWKAVAIVQSAPVVRTKVAPGEPTAPIACDRVTNGAASCMGWSGDGCMGSPRNKRIKHAAQHRPSRHGGQRSTQNPPASCTKAGPCCRDNPAPRHADFRGLNACLLAGRTSAIRLVPANARRSSDPG